MNKRNGQDPKRQNRPAALSLLFFALWPLKYYGRGLNWAGGRPPVEAAGKMRYIPVIVGAVAAAIVAPLVARAIMKRWPRQGKWGINPNRVNCPGCGARQRGVRWPSSWRQAMWGGWTCKNCGCEMDKYGNRMS